MKSTFDYWKDVAVRAFREAAFLAKKNMLLGLLVTMVGLILEWLLNLTSGRLAEKIGGTIVGSYAIVWSLVYVSNILRIPASSDGEKEQTIKRLNAELQELETPKLSSYDQGVRDEIKRKVDGYDESYRLVLRYLLRHGKVIEDHMMGVSPVPKELRKEQVASTLPKLASDGLVSYEQRRTTGGWERVYSIAPGALPFLKEVL